jgi:hypothetical protein
LDSYTRRTTIRQKIEAGLLPRPVSADARSTFVFFGPGCGAPCAACGGTIEPMQHELRQGELRVHRLCASVWLEEWLRAGRR